LGHSVASLPEEMDGVDFGEIISISYPPAFESFAEDTDNQF
jgi:hypothetical protein